MAKVPAFFDANVLASMTLTDLVIECVHQGLFSARWSDKIHHEWMQAVLAFDPSRTRAKLDRRRHFMDRHTPDCLVTGYEQLIASLNLPDVDDRHVLAAALHSRCSLIVTFNLTDFPSVDLTPHRITAFHPDVFFVENLNRDQNAMIAAVTAIRARLKKPSYSVDEYLTKLVKAGLPIFAAELARFKRFI